MLETPQSAVLESLMDKIGEVVEGPLQTRGTHALRWPLALECQNIAWAQAGQHLERNTAKAGMRVKQSQGDALVPTVNTRLRDLLPRRRMFWTWHCLFHPHTRRA